MNKQKIMVLAIAGALTAPGLAMAQSANVSMYGLMDVRWDQSKYSSNTANTVGSLTKQHLSGGQANYIGFRGTEDLGGGLSAFFQIESQIFTDARPDVASQAHTNALFGGRPTYLGLRSTSWGELSAGYQDSVYKDVQRVWNVGAGAAYAGVIMGNGNSTGAVPTPNCGAGFASGTNALNATTGATATTNCSEAPSNTTSFNRTASDTLVFRSVNMSGFRAAVMMGINEFKEPTVTPNNLAAGTSQSNPSMTAYSVTWSGGPFSAAGAYEVHRGFRANLTTVNQDRMAKDTGLQLGGKWNYGQGNVGLGYERLSYANTGGTVAAAANDFKRAAWVLGADYNVSAAGRVYGAYAKTAGNKSCGASLNTIATATVGSACGNDTGTKQYSFGYDHSLSKRTTLYAYYAKIDNNASGTVNYPSDSRTTNATTGGASTQAGAGSGILAGVDQTSINLGMKHTF